MQPDHDYILETRGLTKEFVVVGLQNQLADKVGSWVQVIMGAIFVVCVLAFRRGIVGEC